MTGHLLTYMALIIRLTIYYTCLYDYDSAFRLEAGASNAQDWSAIKTDLYQYQAFTSCRSWNRGACSSPRETCRFRHRCDRDDCGGSHRLIDCPQPNIKRTRDAREDPRTRRAYSKQLEQVGLTRCPLFRFYLSVPFPNLFRFLLSRLIT